VLSGQRILVVEDDYLQATALSDKLRDNGAEVVGPAATLAAAISLLSREPIDAALVDMNLAGEMAVDVIRHLREERVPFIIVTGYNIDPLAEVVKGVPICRKPVVISQICETLNSLV
jgi:DNA-binding response OmpR family regulator